jgi:hypothetical protein
MNKSDYKAKITTEFVSRVRDMREAGLSETEQRKFVREYLGVSKSWGNTIYTELKKTFDGISAYGLEFASDRYVYNTNTDTYVINLKCKRDPLVISGAKHRAICRAYSNWSDDLTANEICVKYSLTPEIFAEYRKIFNLSKDKEPLSTEEVAINSVDESVETLIEEKRYKIYQGYEKQAWKDTQCKANKWDDLNANTLDTLRILLDTWTPPTISKNKKINKSDSGLTFVASLADNHIGEVFQRSEAFAGRDFNSDIACQIIDDYANKIGDTVSKRNCKFRQCLVFITGDFLHSCIDGNTRKGTHLHSDKINEDMFLIGLNTLVHFINKMEETFGSVKVFSVPGNHDSVVFTYMMLAVEKFYNQNKNVEFDISKAWAALHRVQNIAMIVTHGGHDTLKKSLPPKGLKLKSFIQELFLRRSDELAGCTQKIVLSGHKHAFSQEDMGSFEFYCLGSSVQGDNFADAHGLYHTPRQNCLILNDNHVVETIHYYL